jgi:hypothetical protein
MTVPQIDPLSDIPSRQDPTNFAIKGDAFLGDLPTFAAQANALATQVNERVDAAFAAGLESAATNAATTVTKAAEARASELAAAGYANAAAQVSTGFDTLRPKIRPALNLDFVNQEFVDRRVVVSRAGPKSYFGKRKVLGDENLLRFSEQFDNAVWGKAGSTVSANSTSAPDGATTADSLIVQTTATERKSAGYTIALLANTSYVFSLSAKANQLGFVTLTSNRNNTEYFSVTFSLADGTVSQNTTSGGFTVASAASVLQPNGFYRLYVVFSATVAPSAVSAALSNAGTFTPDALGRNSFAGNIGDGVFIWGAQLEQRSALTAYVRTTDYPICTFFNALETAAANVMPIEYDPVSQQCLGIRPESAATNLLLRSEEFDNAAWNKTQSSVLPNTTIAPDGNLTADTFVPNAINAGKSLLRSVSSGSTSFVYSCHFKFAGYRYAYLYFQAGTVTQITEARFDLINGTVTTNNVTGAAFTGLATSIVPIGNGWFRCSVSATGNNALNNVWITCNPNLVTNSINAAFVGDGYSGVYIWGAQLEASTLGVPSSYIPTTTAQVTRLADNIAVPVNEFDYNQNEGALYVEAQTSPIASTYVGLSDGTNSNRIELLATPAGQNRIQISAQGLSQSAQSVGGVTSGVFRHCLSFKRNNLVAYVNGGVASTDRG